MEYLLSALVQLFFFTIIPFLWWLCTAAKKENFFVWIGLKKPAVNGSIVKTLCFVVLVSAAYGVLMTAIMDLFLQGNENITLAASEFAGRGQSALPDIFAYGLIRTGLSEEIFFRGFLGKRFVKRFGFGAGNIMQALLFGAVHGVPIGLAAGNVFLAILITALPGAIGWLQGWLNEKKCGGSILPSWILHAAMNVLSGLTAAF